MEKTLVLLGISLSFLILALAGTVVKLAIADPMETAATVIANPCMTDTKCEDSAVSP